MSERALGLLIVLILTGGAWALGHFSKRAAGAAAFVTLGAILVIDDLVAGPIPWHWGTLGAAMIGIGFVEFQRSPSRRRAAS